MDTTRLVPEARLTGGGASERLHGFGVSEARAVIAEFTEDSRAERRAETRQTGDQADVDVLVEWCGHCGLQSVGVLGSGRQLAQLGEDQQDLAGGRSGGIGERLQCRRVVLAQNIWSRRREPRLHHLAGCLTRKWVETRV